MHTTIDGIARAPRISLFVWDGLPSCLWILFIIPITLIGEYTTITTTIMKICTTSKDCHVCYRYLRNHISQRQTTIFKFKAQNIWCVVHIWNSTQRRLQDLKLSIELSLEFAAKSVNEKETHTNRERERETERCDVSLTKQNLELFKCP